MSCRWSSFTSALYDEVKKYLRRNHIGSFTDLSIDEREHLIQEIENSLAPTAQYHDFANALNLQLETRLSEAVQKEAPHVSSALFSHHDPSASFGGHTTGGADDDAGSDDDESKRHPPQAIPGGPNGILSPSHRHQHRSPSHSSFGVSPTHARTSASPMRSPSHRTVHSMKVRELSSVWCLGGGDCI